ESGHALYEQMAVAEQAHEQAVDEVILTDDDAVDLVQDRGDEVSAPEHRVVRGGCAERCRQHHHIRGWTGELFVSRASRKVTRGARAARTRKRVAAGAGEAGVPDRSSFFIADVMTLQFLSGPFDLALDIGCLHSLPVRDWAAYAAALARLVRPGGVLLLYAFAPSGPATGLTAYDVRAMFTDRFDVVRVEEGRGRPSAW